MYNRKRILDEIVWTIERAGGKVTIQELITKGQILWGLTDKKLKEYCQLLVMGGKLKQTDVYLECPNLASKKIENSQVKIDKKKEVEIEEEADEFLDKYYE